MKFKRLVESDLITELSDDGRWVTFKNGQRTYISKDGEIETGTLKGYNVSNKKAIKGKYKQLQDQAAKKKKKDEKAKKREENTPREFQKKKANEYVSYAARLANQNGYDYKERKEIYDKVRKHIADNIRKGADEGDYDKRSTTDKQMRAAANRVEHYGEKGNSAKSQRKQKRKELTKAFYKDAGAIAKKIASADKDKVASAVAQAAIRARREELQRSKKS